MTIVRCRADRIHAEGTSTQVPIAFECQDRHAAGHFSTVYKCRLITPIQQVAALKIINLQNVSWDMAEREVALLQRVNHPCVTRLLYRFQRSVDNVTYEYMFFEFMPTDLRKLINQLPNTRLDPLDAKLYAWQMFAGLDHIYSRGITHCDVKPSNMIVDPENGRLKIADFGNAKILYSGTSRDPYQVTRYYRAPELLWKTDAFSASIGELPINDGIIVDRWAAGCVFAELLTGRILFPGNNGRHQGELIVETLGFPTRNHLNAMRLTSRPRHRIRNGRGFSALIQGVNFPLEALDILTRMLTYDPAYRMTFETALGHHFFDELRADPPPQRHNGRPIPPLNYAIVEQPTQPSVSGRVASITSSPHSRSIPRSGPPSPPAPITPRRSQSTPWWFFWG